LLLSVNTNIQVTKYINNLKDDLGGLSKID